MDVALLMLNIVIILTRFIPAPESNGPGRSAAGRGHMRSICAAYEGRIAMVVWSLQRQGGLRHMCGAGVAMAVGSATGCVDRMAQGST